MREAQAIIERTVSLNEHYQHVHLSVQEFDTDFKPGQSILARLESPRWDPYLREQWWPVVIKKDEIVVERPGSIVYEPGQVVSVMGAMGQPFRYKRTLRNVLLIADDTPPTPLIMSIPFLLGSSVSVTLVLAGNANDYPTNRLPPEVEVIKADSELAWANQVMTIGWADQVFVVVKPDDEMRRMQRIWSIFKKLRAGIDRSYIFGVMQPALPCGVGACAACQLLLREGEVFTVCTQGPAIDMTTLKLEED
jgi:Iron-sulfur cluster binding domain of dihydroorotate dehydrogenase B